MNGALWFRPPSHTLRRHSVRQKVMRRRARHSNGCPDAHCAHFGFAYGRWNDRNKSFKSTRVCMCERVRCLRVLVSSFDAWGESHKHNGWSRRMWSFITMADDGAITARNCMNIKWNEMKYISDHLIRVLYCASHCRAYHFLFKVRSLWARNDDCMLHIAHTHTHSQDSEETRRQFLIIPLNNLNDETRDGRHGVVIGRSWKIATL